MNASYETSHVCCYCESVMNKNWCSSIYAGKILYYCSWDCYDDYSRNSLNSTEIKDLERKISLLSARISALEQSKTE